MSRAAFIVLALAATAFAEYAFNQVDDIVSRVELCLKPVPQRPSGFYTPGWDCALNAQWSLEDGDGASKESLVNSVPECLSGFNVDAAVVATAKQCLKESLAKDLVPALEEFEYTNAQLNDVSNRIAECLKTIPETANRTPASDCRFDSLDKAQDGYPKESLTGFIVPCLTGKKIDAAVVAAAQTCLTASLAKPLSA